MINSTQEITLEQAWDELAWQAFLVQEFTDFNEYTGTGFVVPVINEIATVTYGHYRYKLINPQQPHQGSAKTAGEIFQDCVRTAWKRCMMELQHPLFMFLELVKHEADGSNQFFYNMENLGQHRYGWETNEGSSSSDGTSENRRNDTPQNRTDDINIYLTGYQKSNDSNDALSEGRKEFDETIENNNVKSSLGDITLQFKNFIEFPSFLDKIIKALEPCFLDRLPLEQRKELAFYAKLNL